MKLKLRQVTDVTQDTKVFKFDVEKKPKYKAGQFMQLHVPHDNSDKRGQKRWFTVSASPNEDYISMTTKFSPKGSSFKSALLKLKTGDKLMAMNPMGDFVLPNKIEAPSIFIAGGIGVTPFRSMIKTLQGSEQLKKITLVHAVKTEKDSAYSSEFENSGIKYIKVVSEPSPGWKGRSGRVDYKLLSEIADLTKSKIYISGPGGLVESLKKALKSNGVPNRQIMTDYFPGY